MNLIIPFTKDIKFDTNIAEITSISLEHDWTYNERELLGNFTITGEYKTHEVSVNKEPFEYVLPFSVDLSNRLDENSISLEIKDFTYDIKDNNTLTVTIEYEVDGTEINDDREFEEMLDTAIRDIDEEKEEESIGENTQDTPVIEDISKKDEDSYVTYHIHIMKENETIESICTKYKTNENILKDYNDISTLSIGDKLIIPDIETLENLVPYDYNFGKILK